MTIIDYYNLKGMCSLLSPLIYFCAGLLTLLCPVDLFLFGGLSFLSMLSGKREIVSKCVQRMWLRVLFCLGDPPFPILRWVGVGVGVGARDSRSVRCLGIGAPP